MIKSYIFRYFILLSLILSNGLLLACLDGEFIVDPPTIHSDGGCPEVFTVTEGSVENTYPPENPDSPTGLIAVTGGGAAKLSAGGGGGAIQHDGRMILGAVGPSDTISITINAPSSKLGAEVSDISISVISATVVPQGQHNFEYGGQYYSISEPGGDSGEDEGFSIIRTGVKRDSFTNTSVSSPSRNLSPGTASSSCVGCSSSSTNIKFGAMSINIRPRQSDTLANQAVYYGGSVSGSDVDIAIDLNGDFFRVKYRKGWSVAEHDSGSQRGYVITDDKLNAYYYWSSSSGSIIYGNHKLHKVVHNSGHIVEYDYSGGDFLESKTYKYNGQAIQKVEFIYNSGNLAEIKFYDLQESTEYPVRTVNVTYTPVGTSEERVLQSIDCDSCGGAAKGYNYQAGSQYFDKGLSQNVVSRYRLKDVSKNVNGQDIVYYSYEYDNNGDLINEFAVDQGDNKHRVTQWYWHPDYSDVRFRKDYVTSLVDDGLPVVSGIIENAPYRLTAYIYDSAANRVLKEIRYYKDLFHDENEVGPYEIFSLDNSNYDKISYPNDYQSDSLKTERTYLNASEYYVTATEYDTEIDRLLSRFKKLNESSSTEIRLAEYSYWDNGNMKTSKNAFGGESVYFYDSDDRKIRTLGPDTGIRPESRMNYYDEDRDKGRVKYTADRFKVGNEDSFIGREYHYDVYGRLAGQVSGVIFSLSGDELIPKSFGSGGYVNAVAADYQYDLFHNLIETSNRSLLNDPNFFDPNTLGDKINISQTIYDENGIALGKMTVLEDPQSPGNYNVVNASKYTYDDEGRIIIESVMSSSIWQDPNSVETDIKSVIYSYDPNDFHVDVLFGNPQVSWVHTVNQYDFWGRKISVIEDAREFVNDGRFHLETRYYYNMQNEIVMTVSPNGVISRTIRDGRGQVIRQITSNESLVFDENGNLTQEQGKEMNHYRWHNGKDGEIVVSFTYDGAGNMTSRTEPHPGDPAKVVKTIYVYDGLGRMSNSYKVEIEPEQS